LLSEPLVDLGRDLDDEALSAPARAFIEQALEDLEWNLDH